jgi:hypothetical protein
MQVAVRPLVSPDEEAAGGVLVHAQCLFNTWQYYFSECKPPQNSRQLFLTLNAETYFFAI